MEPENKKRVVINKHESLTSAIITMIKSVIINLEPNVDLITVYYNINFNADGTRIRDEKGDYYSIIPLHAIEWVYYSM